jgi:hypothetical protein
VHRRQAPIGSRWGSLVGGPLGYGGRHYSLVVFPPGTNGRERWLLRTWRWWRYVGPLLAAVVLGEVGDQVGFAQASVVAAVAFVAPLLWLRRALRRPRRDLAVVHAEVGLGPSSAIGLVRYRRLVSLSSTLADAERALDRGELTPLDFQRIWGAVHAEALAFEAA